MSAFSQENTILSVDSLVANLDLFVGKEVVIVGQIIHVCPVGGLKMKLKSESGIIVKIKAGEDYKKFDKTLNKAMVRVRGLVLEEKATSEFISEAEREKRILCHIDYTFCKDTAWIEDKVRTGKADSISIKATNKLRVIMESKKKNYVSVPCILPRVIEIIK